MLPRFHVPEPPRPPDPPAGCVAAADARRSPWPPLAASSPSAPAHAANPVTPGNFTGYGFDQCLAPEPEDDGHLAEAARRSAPSASTSPATPAPAAASRNLTPTWVSTQLADGLAAAADHARPAGLLLAALPALRRRIDPTINPSRGTNGYVRRPAPQGARRGRRRPSAAAQSARASSPGSTLWYDLEGFDDRNTTLPRVRAVRSSAPGPTQLHALGYVSGVYSSAGSGIKMLDDARVHGPATGSRCPTRSGSPAGTAWRTPPRRTSAATAGSPTAG